MAPYNSHYLHVANNGYIMYKPQSCSTR